VLAAGVLAAGVAAPGVLAAGVAAAGVLAAGVLTAGVLAAGVLAPGVLTAGMPAAGVLTAGMLSAAVLTAGVPTAGVPAVGAGIGAEPVAEVAACACREKTSKTTRIPAAKIAACTARRAMRRKISCGMSNSRSARTDRTSSALPVISVSKPRLRTRSPAISQRGWNSRARLRMSRQMFAHHRTASPSLQQGLHG